PSGSRLFVTWRADADAQPQPTDVRKLNSQLAQADLGRVSVWSLPSGTRSPVVARFGGPWDVLRPLGTGAGAPVALVNGDAVGLVLPSGPDSALDRLTDLARTDPGESVDPDTAVTRLCRVLADTSESATTRKLIPAGAYHGPLCG
ncbi:MAG TPA: hypothetical protein VFX70_02050, partial [Mycobacteriales bacterium]|nr:hypothetical protein [Mycobacteriales bacterium]